MVRHSNREKPQLFSNNVRSQKNTHFINIRSQGVGKNTLAIAAKVYDTANGVTQMQETHAGDSYPSGAPAEMHFGLGAAVEVDEIRVVWPRPHYVEQKLTDTKSNPFITIHQSP
ncbi:MAG: ASPIC/UnbV domain-containing protein [Pseudomonadales bacterium]|nr:ASPIC/UnbV domain-containing protein [Pseudomonadales bacterium]MDG1444561.1 ASPIC/UnbV domain-containing protein [Pseudomonadales bacterium]